MKLLLLSSSRVANTDYLEHAKPMIKEHLGSAVTEVLFIPYAGISIGFDAYQEMAAKAFQQFGYALKSIHQFSDPKIAIENAQAIAVGGGNTFCLLNSLYQHDLISMIRQRVKQNIPYVGWSAGTNICAPSIKTTNDMPIVEPPSFESLNFVPFQINPHYIEGNPPGHNGETRAQRINEFLLMNPTQTVIAIPEGTALKVDDNQLVYVADKAGFIFTAKNGQQVLHPKSDISDLLQG